MFERYHPFQVVCIVDIWMCRMQGWPDPKRSPVAKARLSESSISARNRADARRISLIVFPDNKSAIDCYLRIGCKHAGVEFHQFGGRGPKGKLVRFCLNRSDLGYEPVEDS